MSKIYVLHLSIFFLQKIHICIWKKNVKEEVMGFLAELSKNILDSSSYLSNELPSFLIAAYSSVLNYQDSLPDSDKDIVNELWKNVSACCYENLLHKVSNVPRSFHLIKRKILDSTKDVFVNLNFVF